MARFYQKTLPVLWGEIRIYLLDTTSGLDVLIEGGDAPHIGSVAVSPVPESAPVKGDSARSVCITYSGHKEDLICLKWASVLSEVYQGPVVVSAGVHYDHATKADIAEILAALDDALEEISGSQSLQL